MSEERFMRELGDLAKDEPARDRGLPPELTRAFDGAELDAILEGARKDLGATQDAGASRGANVVSLEAASLAAKRRRWLAASMLAPLAAAAAFVLFAQRARKGEDAIPAYDVVVEGGEQAARAPAAAGPVENVHIARDGRFTLVLRPRVPGSAEVRARVLIEHAGALTPWNAEVRVSEEGAIRVDGKGALASLPSGASRVVVVVAGHEPTDDEAHRALDGDVTGVKAFAQRIDVAP